MRDLNNVDICKLERKTLGQKENVEWYQARRNRLTASSFGKICLRRSSTPSHNLIKELFYRNSNLKTKAIQYGIENEKVAIKKFETLSNVKVRDCGFFVCPNFCFLGASPDGINDNNKVIEVKCLYACKSESVRKAAKKNHCVLNT
ncbi:hypothetical protein RN001_007806 [Aquatica leii]|uniref:YqaJ viral recombinase domain-containing protein n=1 Tax=Aquatica leii TaxID=1421715 RepID=A0AAN7SR36_9COLE|nr:hypothetical protein RN001_007806 [Aquatica leii]